MNSNGHISKSPFPIPGSEMRERYLKLYMGAVNDVLRFNYQMHATSLPAAFAPLREKMKLAGMVFTVKGGPDITTEGEFEMRAEMLEALHEDFVVVWDCTGDMVNLAMGRGHDHGSYENRLPRRNCQWY